MTELETRILTLFQKLNEKDKQTALNMIELIICCPDFSDAMRAARITAVVVLPSAPNGSMILKLFEIGHFPMDTRKA